MKERLEEGIRLQRPVPKRILAVLLSKQCRTKLISRIAYLCYVVLHFSQAKKLLFHSEIVHSPEVVILASDPHCSCSARIRARCIANRRKCSMWPNSLRVSPSVRASAPGVCWICRCLSAPPGHWKMVPRLLPKQTRKSLWAGFICRSTGVMLPFSRSFGCLLYRPSPDTTVCRPFGSAAHECGSFITRRPCGFRSHLFLRSPG